MKGTSQSYSVTVSRLSTVSNLCAIDIRRAPYDCRDVLLSAATIFLFLAILRKIDDFCETRPNFLKISFVVVVRLFFIPWVAGKCAENACRFRKFSMRFSRFLILSPMIGSFLKINFFRAQKPASIADRTGIAMMNK